MELSFNLRIIRWLGCVDASLRPSGHNTAVAQLLEALPDEVDRRRPIAQETEWRPIPHERRPSDAAAQQCSTSSPTVHGFEAS